jgi:hypothetical protein
MPKQLSVFFKKHGFLVLFSILIAYFTWSVYRWIDPDFGWHYKVGEIIATQGFPNYNPFSYTMPSYHYVDYEWLSNTIYYLAYNFLGYWFLALLHAALIVAAPLVAISAFKNTKYYLVPFLLSLSSLSLRAGVRPQVFNWFLLAVFIKFFYNERVWVRFRWFMPILMVLWVNLHGSYVLGLGLMGILIVSKSIGAKKIDISNFLVLFLSIGATLINPYGVKNWQEVILQMSQGELFRKTVSEWASAIFNYDFGYFAIISFTLPLMYLNRSKVKLWEWVVLAGSFTGVYSGRYAPLSSLLMAPLLAKHIQYVYDKTKNITEGQRRFVEFYKIISLVSIAILVISIFSASRGWRMFNQSDYYPSGAANYLKNDSKSQNIFTEYGLGGYLIQQLPGKKFFIDGRMSGFSWDAPPGQSDHALREYMNINCGLQDFSDTLNKYNTDTILLRLISNEAGKPKENILKPLVNLVHSFGLIYCKEQIDLNQKAIDMGWKQVYKDPKFVIYQRQ